MITCSVCGHLNDPERVTCEKCGSDLSDSPDLMEFEDDIVYDDDMNFDEYEEYGFIDDGF